MVVTKMSITPIRAKVLPPAVKTNPQRQRLETRLAHYKEPTFLSFQATRKIPIVPVAVIGAWAAVGNAPALGILAGAESVNLVKQAAQLIKMDPAQRRDLPKPTLIARTLGKAMAITGALVGVATFAVHAALTPAVLLGSIGLLLVGTATLGIEKVVRLVQASRTARQLQNLAQD